MANLDRYYKIFGLKVAAMKEASESYSSEVFILTLNDGGKVVLKLPFTKLKLTREYDALTRLKGRLPVPEVLGLWEGDGESSSALLMTYIDGESITGSIDPELAFQMGELLAQMHEIPMERYTLIEQDFVGWWKSLWIRFHDEYDRMAGMIDQAFLDQCSEKLEALYKGLPPADGPCLVHLDYRPGNILVKDNKVVGLVDFECARGGSSNIDFVKMKQQVWDRFEGTREAFLEGYKKVRRLPDFEVTMPFYTFANAFAGMHWCALRKQLDTDFCRSNMEILERMLEE